MCVKTKHIEVSVALEKLRTNEKKKGKSNNEIFFALNKVFEYEFAFYAHVCILSGS